MTVPEPLITVLDTCPSTSSEFSAPGECPHGAVIATREQTAGRGQRGNSWEAEPGKNLTFSILLRPAALLAARQFELSMVVSLAIADAIDALLPEGVKTAVKWPNDIYIGNEKVCGILIENRLSGPYIDSSIAGIGININQRRFLSDAPNPTSVILHNGGVENSLGECLRDVCKRILAGWARYEENPDAATLKRNYFARLIWTRGEHPFSDADGPFMAHITDVDSDGTLHLSNGRRYAFKEVAFRIW